MANRVTPAEVRNRLKNLTTADITDAVLDDLAFIPLSEAEIDTILADRGISYAGMTTAKQTLVKGAQIAMVCYRIVTDAPEDFFKIGVLDSTASKGADKKVIAEILEKEWKRLLSRAGVRLISIYTGISKGDDMIPDGEDLTNVLFDDTDEPDVSLSG